MDLRGGEGVPGEESGEGEALVVPEWPGWWRRLQLPETGKKASLRRLQVVGVPWRWPEVASVLEWVRGPPYISQRGRLAAVG